MDFGRADSHTRKHAVGGPRNSRAGRLLPHPSDPRTAPTKPACGENQARPTTSIGIRGAAKAAALRLKPRQSRAYSEQRLPALERDDVRALVRLQRVAG